MTASMKQTERQNPKPKTGGYRRALDFTVT